MLKKTFLFFFLITISLHRSECQPLDSTSFKINTRFSFYTFEKQGEFLLHVPEQFKSSNLKVRIKFNDSETVIRKGTSGKKILRVPFDLNLQPDVYKVAADISVPGRKMKYQALCELLILSYKPNEVKTDRFTGGLIVNKREFFPFGFYCYSPVYPTLPEEEVVKGFNLISPYQKILPGTLRERKSYMDRCAQLGMKVNYNLLSVTGGGGVGSRIEGLTEKQKIERLLNELSIFKDHPALLAWYISDEPTGNGIAPDSLLKIYNIIKKNDPWHPVTIVFMAPFLASKKYADALDIVMADPYPIPDSPAAMAGDAAGQLSKEFAGKRPVWIVPQAFGGGEWWSREPSIQEMRLMTYHSIINGARGIQYFVRQGLSYFPKSAATWAECGRMAVEIAELTPWLLSDEETIPVRSGSKNIAVLSALHNDQLMVMAVNKTNSPQRADFSVAGSVAGRAGVIFENRSVPVNSGYFSDVLSSFGSQVYIIDLKPHKDTIKFWTYNLTKDPGFEDLSSPGVPASCYARNGGDRGGTYFLDTREHVEGNHSVRMVTPGNNNSIKLRFFPVNVRNGATYIISVWAKAESEQRPVDDIEKNKPQYFEISFGDYGTKQFPLTDNWKKYVTSVTIPYDNDLPLKTNVILQMPSAGVAWFDMLQVAEAIDIKQCINPELNWTVKN